MAPNKPANAAAIYKSGEVICKPKGDARCRSTDQAQDECEAPSKSISQRASQKIPHTTADCKNRIDQANLCNLCIKPLDNIDRQERHDQVRAQPVDERARH